MYMRYSTVLPRNFLCHITDILQTLMTERCHETFTDSLNCYGFTEVSWSHGTFPDFRTTTELLRIHGTFTDSGITESFGNVCSIVDKTRLNPCIVKINHGNVTENSRNSQGLLSTYPIKVKLQLLRKYQNIFQNIPNYRKVTNKSQNTSILCKFFLFPWFVMGGSGTRYDWKDSVFSRAWTMIC